jgi:hypothetical protein
MIQNASVLEILFHRVKLFSQLMIYNYLFQIMISMPGSMIHSERNPARNKKTKETKKTVGEPTAF